MILFSPEIDGNKYYQKVEQEIVKECGLEVNEYLTNKEIFTKELWDRHFDSIVLVALRVNVPVGFQTIGHLTLQVGGKLPTPIYSQILDYCQWEKDRTLGWKGNTIEHRKNILQEFREQLSVYYEQYMKKFG